MQVAQASPEDDSVRYHPMDWSTVTKGMVFPREAVNRIMGIRPNVTDAEYAMKLLQFRGLLMKECERLNNPVVAACDKDQLRVLTDKEAVEYTRQQIEVGWRKARRYVRHQLQIDSQHLDEEQRSVLERSVLVNGRKLQALKAEERRQRAIERQKIREADERDAKRLAM